MDGGDGAERIVGAGVKESDVTSNLSIYLFLENKIVNLIFL